MSLSKSARAQMARQRTKVMLADGSTIYTMRQPLRTTDDTLAHLLVPHESEKSRRIINRCNEIIADYLNSDEYLSEFPRDTRLSRLGFQRITAEQIAAAPSGYGVIEIVEPRAFRRLTIRFHAYINPSFKHRGFDKDFAEVTLPYIIIGVSTDYRA